MDVSTEIPHLRGLADVLSRYDGVICDVWGVLHNGAAAFKDAVVALVRARTAGIPVVLLTNAPRPALDIEAQLARLGIGRDAYDAIVTSGGVTRDLLVASGVSRFFHLGPERDAPLYAGLEARPAAFEDSPLVLCTGLHDDERETAETYRPLLERAGAASMPLLCANPDLVVERAGRLIPCAGAIADLYERIGGTVTWVGKPKPLVYDHAVAALSSARGKIPEGARILCIGDALRTDIAGARGAGFDALLVLAGIHAEDVGLLDGQHEAAKLDRLLNRAVARPTMTITGLRW